jgi:hypothetical protein
VSHCLSALTATQLRHVPSCPADFDALHDAASNAVRDGFDCVVFGDVYDARIETIESRTLFCRAHSPLIALLLRKVRSVSE